MSQTRAMEEDEQKQPYKASIPEKVALFTFVAVPIMLLLLKKRWGRWLQRHAVWTQKNINTLITINLVLVLILACMLLGLRVWLTHVRGW